MYFLMFKVMDKERIKLNNYSMLENKTDIWWRLKRLKQCLLNALGCPRNNTG